MRSKVQRRMIAGLAGTVVLGALAIVGGALNLPFTDSTKVLEHWLEPVVGVHELGAQKWRRKVIEDGLTQAIVALGHIATKVDAEFESVTAERAEQALNPLLHVLRRNFDDGRQSQVLERGYRWKWTVTTSGGE